MLCGSLTVSAADVDGTWAAVVETPNGSIDLTYTLKAKGDTLTGTLSTPMGDVEISEGKINGDAISLSVIVSPGGSDIKFLQKGKVSGDKIEFTSEREGSGEPREFVATRTGS